MAAYIGVYRRIIRSFGVEIFPILGICRMEMKQVKFYREKGFIYLFFIKFI